EDRVVEDRLRGDGAVEVLPRLVELIEALLRAHDVADGDVAELELELRADREVAAHRGVRVDAGVLEPVVAAVTPVLVRALERLEEAEAPVPAAHIVRGPDLEDGERLELGLEAHARERRADL